MNRRSWFRWDGSPRGPHAPRRLAVLAVAYPVRIGFIGSAEGLQPLVETWVVVRYLALAMLSEDKPGVA